MTGWNVYHEHVPWHPAEGPRPLPLGRNIVRDSRAAGFRYQRSAKALRTLLHTRNIPLLDQGQIGSCTGNAQEGALGTDPIFVTLPPGTVLNENGAIRIYSAAEIIDGNGSYPPNDFGSSGASAAKAARQMGLIAGEMHCTTLAEVLDALMNGPVTLGMNWYDSMDQPASNGLVSISPGASIRGGHEVLARGPDVDARTIFLDNSWGDWGPIGGSFTMTWDTLDRLLGEQGDGTVSIPLSQPAPVPAPVTDVDTVLWQQVQPWTSKRHTRADLARLQTSLETWAHAHGFYG